MSNAHAVASPSPRPTNIGRAAMGPWTEEIVALLKELHGSGLSSNQIARRIGVTRNAVIGKLHRMGLTDKGRKTQRQRPATPVRTRQAERRDHPQQVRRIAAVAKARAAPSLTASVPAEISASAVPFPRASMLTCAWPLWDDATPVLDREVCGAPALDGHSYCAAHARVASRHGG